MEPLFVGLCGLILTGWLAMDLRKSALEGRLAAMAQRLARIEGLIEGAGLFCPAGAAGAGD